MSIKLIIPIYLKKINIVILSILNCNAYKHASCAVPLDKTNKIQIIVTDNVNNYDISLRLANL